MSTWDELPLTWNEWTIWEWGNPNLYKMDLVSEDYTITINDEYKDYVISGKSLSDRDLIKSNGQITFQKYVDNSSDETWIYADYQIMNKEIENYIDRNTTFTLKMLDIANNKIKLLVNCRLNKKPNYSNNGSGNKEDVVVDFEKMVNLP